MVKPRITDCEIGPIHHRPTTALSRVKRCVNGHLAPRYVSKGGCAACVKLRCYEYRGVGRTMQRFADYTDALAQHLDSGGYLLCLDGGEYGVTDNERVVRKMRGAQWLRRCNAIQCWNEAEIGMHLGPEQQA
jgi:hypothetical protein